MVTSPRYLIFLGYECGPGHRRVEAKTLARQPAREVTTNRAFPVVASGSLGRIARQKTLEAKRGNWANFIQLWAATSSTAITLACEVPVSPISTGYSQAVELGSATKSRSLHSAAEAAAPVGMTKQLLTVAQ